jgi:hypothetical protein
VTKPRIMIGATIAFTLGGLVVSIASAELSQQLDSVPRISVSEMVMVLAGFVVVLAGSLVLAIIRLNKGRIPLAAGRRPECYEMCTVMTTVGEKIDGLGEKVDDINVRLAHVEGGLEQMLGRPINGRRPA